MTGPPDDPDRHVGTQLETLLDRIGVDETEIVEARERNKLGLLAVERLVLPEPNLHDLAAVVARTGIDAELISRIWRALGFAAVGPEQELFTDADVAFLGVVAELLAVHLVDDDLVIHLTRVFGSSLSRIAAAFVDAVESSAAPILADDDALAADRFARIAPRLLPMVAGATDHVFRRHVRSQARSRLGDDQTSADPIDQVVGFADLVGFTALSQQIDIRDLATVVHRFETIAHDIVDAAGGRVVKMIGDEVMFCVGDVDVAADLALALSDAYTEDDRLGDVRIGLAFGGVLARDADLHGPVVNRASRLVSLARPGTVLVDAAVREALGDRPDLAWRSLGNRTLKNIGKEAVHVLRRGPEGDRSR